MSYSYKFLLCVLLLFLTNALKAIEVFQFPSSLAGKVMVAYWANSNDYECYFFKNENDFVFVDAEEFGVKKYSWNPSAKILTNHDFGEDVSLTLMSPYGGQFTIREGNQQLGSGTFVLYDSLWDLDRNGVADGQQVLNGSLPNLGHQPDLSSDEDADGLVLAREFSLGTNSNNADTDGDGVPDGLEVREKTSPVDATKFNSFSQGLVAYYPFDGHTNDDSGNGNHGTIVGNVSAATDRNGLSNKSYYFDGATGCIVSESSQLSVTEGSFTLSLWIRPEDIENLVDESTYGTSYSHKYAIGGFWGDSGSGISLAAGTNGISVLEHGHQFLPVVLSYPSAIGTNWVQVTLTCSDNNSPILYLNGNYVRSGLDTGRIKYLSVFNQSGLNGTEGIGGGNYGRFKGQLDDIRVYSRSLSAGEVASLYAAESSPKSSFQIIEGSYTWHEAKADAEARGGRLAVLDTQEKINRANVFLQSQGSWSFMWIGLSDDQNEGQWKWINGQDLAFSNWQPYQPSGLGPLGGDEDYAHILPHSGENSGMWNDLPNEGGYNSPIGYLLELLEVSLDFVGSSNGSIAGAGNYELGATAILTATPNLGYTFAGWTGDASSTANPLSITMDADKTVGANFYPDLADNDGDGLTNYDEAVIYKSNLNSSDTDGDQFSDFDEIHLRKTNPNVFTAGITSSLNELVINIKKLMPRYVAANNFGAREYTARGLPPGITINKKTGVISGKANRKGVYHVRITAIKRDKKKKIVQTASSVKKFTVK